MEDQELTILERVAQGDQSAVNECVEQYGDLIWSLARRFLGGSPDAEDAVQEIFIEVWTSAERFNREVGKEVTFISTIARRRLIDRLRKNNRSLDTSPIEDAPEANLADGEGEQAGAAEVEKVVEVLDTMEPKQRQILYLSLYEGYSHSEIAARMDMPLGTVKTKVRRGLVFVREQLNIDDETAGERAG